MMHHAARRSSVFHGHEGAVGVFTEVLVARRISRFTRTPG
jgi:hypothetical protein